MVRRQASRSSTFSRAAVSPRHPWPHQSSGTCSRSMCESLTLPACLICTELRLRGECRCYGLSSYLFRGTAVQVHGIARIDPQGAAACPPCNPRCKRHIYVQIELRSLVPVVTVDSLAVLARFSMRAAAYSNMSEAWSARPSVSVAANPRAWWRHAIMMVKHECQKMRRHTTSIVAAMRRRKMRHTHALLYRRVHMGQATFRAPDRRCAIPSV